MQVIELLPVPKFLVPIFEEQLKYANEKLHNLIFTPNDNYIRTSAINIDKEHLHNHLIVNSVSFENGYKIQMSKKDLQYLKDYSDKICLEIGASVVPKKDKTNYIKRNEYRVAERGESWKFKLINAIDLSIAESTCKEDFIKLMNKLGYQVNWTDTRKYITYTTPEGYKCRDNKLFEEKYLKGNVEDEFRKLEQANEGRKCEYQSNNSRDLFGYRNGEHKFREKITQNNFRDYEERISNYERKIERYRGRTSFKIKENKMESKVDCILSGIIAISNKVSNPQINNRPKRKIRRCRTLSKQVMKEYAIKHANSSGFDWFDEEKDEM